jgi:hypothetical protein
MAFVQSQIDIDTKPAASANKRPPAVYILAAVVLALAAIGASVFMVPEKSAEAPLVANPMPSLSPPAPSIAEKKQFDPLKALDEIFDGRDRDYAVTVSAEKGQAHIGKDPLRFRVRSAKTGYVYLLMVGSDRSDFFLLFPNAVDQGNRIKAGEQLDLPRPEWKMIAAGPAGTDHFIAIVSDHPRDFRAAGLTTVDPFAEFPLNEAARLHGSYAGATPLFAGKATCASGSSPACSESYGAAAFSIEEIEEQKIR